MKRRTASTALAGITMGMALSACGTDTGTQNEEASAQTVPTAFGDVPVPETTDRVVTLGFTDHDMVLALGIVPVALNRWYESMSDGVGSWAEDEVGGAEPELFTTWTDISREQVAALDPDAIIGQYFEYTDETYADFSDIAPTLGPPEGFIPYGVPWQESAELTGRFLGLHDEARSIIADVESRISAVRDEHPAFEGKTINYARYQEDGNFYAYTEQDLRIRLLTELGFTLAPAIAELEQDAFTTTISPEQTGLLDADVLILNTQEALDHPTMRNRDVVGRGGAFVIDEETEMAMSASTVLSIPEALERIIEPLEKAATAG